MPGACWGCAGNVAEGLYIPPPAPHPGAERILGAAAIRPFVRVHLSMSVPAMSNPRWLSLSAALLGVALSSPAAGQTRKVSPPPLRGPSGTVTETSLRPDGAGLVYVQESTIDSLTKVLFAVDDDGAHEIARLDGGLAEPFLLAPSGRSVVFRRFGHGPSDSLVAVSIDGRFPPRRVSPPEVLSVEPDYAFAAHDRVVFRGTPEGGPLRLYSASSTGRQPATALDALGDPHGVIGRFVVSPDGRWVAYTANRDNLQRYELFVAPSDGSAPARKVSGTFLVNGFVQQFRFSPDSGRLVYLANQERPESNELYSVPVLGDAPAIRLNPHGSPTSDVAADYEITPDGASVLYRHNLTAGHLELFRVPIKGVVPPTILNPPLVSNGGVRSFAQVPDGSIVYRADQEVDERVELYHLVEGRPPVKLSTDLFPIGQDVEYFQVGPDGQRVAYVVTPSNQTHLVTLDGSIGPVTIPAPGAAEFHPFAFSADGERLVFQQGGSLHSLLLDGASAPLVILQADGEFSVDEFELELSGGRAVAHVGPPYWQSELYAVALDGATPPQRISAPLPMETPLEEAFGSEISPDGRWAVFGFGAIPEHRLLAANLATGAAPIVLTDADVLVPDGEPWFWISPDSSRVLFRTNASELHTVPIDGSAASVLLGGISRVNEARFAPGGARFLYLDAEARLQSAAVDGTSAPVPLGGFPPPAITFNFDRFRFAADGARVAYSYRIDGVPGLRIRSAPTDGSGAAVVLVPPQGVERLYGVGAGDRVVFQTRSGPSATLWSIPIDASAAPVPLATAALAETPEDKALVGGGYVYYEVAERLFGVPIDGSGPAVAFSPTLRGYLRAAAGDRLLFVGYEPLVALTDFYSVPGDGSAPPVRISRNVPGGSVYYSTFHLSPDGARLVYLHDVGGEYFGLTKAFAAPIDGSAEPVDLVPPGYGEFEPLWSFEVSADASTAALELVTLDGSAKVAFSELYLAPCDGSSPPVRVAAPPGWINYFSRYHLDATGRSVLYESNLDERLARELYVTRFPPVKGAKPPRAAVR